MADTSPESKGAIPKVAICEVATQKTSTVKPVWYKELRIVLRKCQILPRATKKPTLKTARTATSNAASRTKTRTPTVGLSSESKVNFETWARTAKENVLLQDQLKYLKARVPLAIQIIDSPGGEAIKETSTQTELWGADVENLQETSQHYNRTQDELTKRIEELTDELGRTRCALASLRATMRQTLATHKHTIHTLEAKKMAKEVAISQLDAETRVRQKTIR